MPDIIFKTIHGSHLFGTNTPTSDMDYKGVFKESLDRIILGVDSKQVVSSTGGENNRNTKDDTDTDLKEIRTFIKDCLAGQTYALELLFAPRDKWVASSSIWESLILHSDKLVTKNIMPFIGYCRSQAQKYSLKGTRLTALEEVVEYLEAQDVQLNLFQVLDGIELNEYVKLDSYFQPNGHEDKYLSVLGIKLQTNKFIKEILPPLRTRLSQYGDRTIKTQSEGHDWKAYSHAFRIMWELEELLTNQMISFPNPNVQYLLDIKQGKIDFEQMQDYMFTEMERILAIPNNLPEPDRKFWDNWILELYTTYSK